MTMCNKKKITNLQRNRLSAGAAAAAAAANAAVAIQRCRFGVLLAAVGKQRCAQFAAEKLLVGAKWVCANGWVLYSVMKGLASKK